MELDTGAAVSIISDQTRRSLFPDLQLRNSSLVLKTYTDELMQVVGQLNVQVKYGSQEEKVVLVVVGGNWPSLFGRNWLKYLRLDWGKIASVQTTRSESVSVLIKRHQQFFTSEFVMPYKAKLHQDSSSRAHYLSRFEPPSGRSLTYWKSKGSLRRSLIAIGQLQLFLFPRRTDDFVSAVTIK